MKRLFIAIALITGLSLTFMAQDNTSTYTKVGDDAPTFRFMTIDGKEFNTAQLKGKVVMINFFATWCPPCKKELPVLQKNISEKYSNNSDFVLVVVGREHNAGELIKFAEDNKYMLPFAPDPERDIYSLFAEKTIPRNVIIDKNGKISFQSIGYTEGEFNKLEQHLADLLK
ncbi:MAG TPA: TlpA disulfide reductase family protein [Bacteroidales bacterium]|nr:TlpA disulfide reductase family protein [Bacteroidales bacterium]